MIYGDAFLGGKFNSVFLGGYMGRGVLLHILSTLKFNLFLRPGSGEPAGCITLFVLKKSYCGRK